MVDCVNIFKKRVTADYVDLSVGRVYFRPLTNYMVIKAQAKSTILKESLNNAMFFYLMDRFLCLLGTRKYNRLNIVDGNKVRSKTREILSRHGVIKEEFTEEEKKSFDGQYEDIKKNYLTG